MLTFYYMIRDRVQMIFLVTLHQVHVGIKAFNLLQEQLCTCIALRDLGHPATWPRVSSDRARACPFRGTMPRTASNSISVTARTHLMLES